MDPRSVAVTRRDAPDPDPLRVTVRDDDFGVPGPRSAGLLRLPAELASRFGVVGELPHQGFEADLLLVRDRRGGEFVVKLYRPGIAPNHEVRRKLAALECPHVVKVLEASHGEGRDYEIQEYVTGGSLRRYMAPSTGPPPGEGRTARARELVRQLADGLSALHGAGIVHRDVKPDNILVHEWSPAVRVALSDFGLSRAIDASVVFGSTSATIAYAAPEIRDGEISPAADWWALGMTVLEFAGGRHPFENMTDRAVWAHLRDQPMDTMVVEDARLRLLCRGLLTKNAQRRWGEPEVRRWLAGQDPPVADETVGASRSEREGALQFDRRWHREPVELARALTARPEMAAERFFGTRPGVPNPEAAWGAFREWLVGLDDREGADVEGRQQLVDILMGRQPPHAKLLHLVRWLDPTAPPSYRGAPADADGLMRLAYAAETAEDQGHRTAVAAVREMFDHRLLWVLAGFRDAEGLHGVDDRWRAHAASWDRLAGQASPSTAVPRRAADAPEVLAQLLALAVRPDETAAGVRTAINQAALAVGRPVPWFDGFLAGVADDPVGQLVAVRAAPAAAAEAVRAWQAAEAEREQARAREVYWHSLEAQRTAGRDAAVGRALLGVGGLAVAWFFGSILFSLVQSAGFGSGERAFSEGALALVVFLVLLVQAACELVLAGVLAGGYHPGWSLLTRLGVAWTGIRRFGSSTAHMAQQADPRLVGCGGCLLVVILGTVVSSLTLSLGLWWLFPVCMAVAYVTWTAVRYSQWWKAQEEVRAATLADGPQTGARTGARTSSHQFGERP